jgi:tRNA-2-methylthio-N6-dimethylallyladenosine synthase
MVRKTSSRNTLKDLKDELLSRLDNLDFVFQIKETNRLAEILEEAEPTLDFPQLEESELKDYLRIKPQYQSKTQALIPIQIGCDKYCTYCIVPYARGREQSRPMEDILEECKQVVENGSKEILLIGQTVNSYGKSLLDKQSGKFEGIDDPFVKLLTEIDKLSERGLNRLRFTSPHPRDYSDALIEAHASLKTLTPHFHLPVQAGDDEVLKRMNRQYTVEKYKKIIDKIRARIPDASITSDIIVGFCGETDEQFENTAKLYQDIQWDMAYLARYSPRTGTTSVRAFKDDVPREKKAERWHRLNDLLEKSAYSYHQKLVGKNLEVLVEKYNEETGECEGKSRENKLVQFQGNSNLVGSIVEVKAVKALEWLVKGDLQGRKESLIA